MIVTFLFSLLFQPVFATQVVTESFTTSQNYGSGAMVWNIARGELHPPLKVIGFDRGSGPEDYDFSVGDGRHGSFINESDYRRLNCASVSGLQITIDTDECSDLQFTVFHLLATWTLKPVGSNPLKIRSQSTVTVDGTIDCSGEDGAAGNTSFNSVRSGGIGRCGGGDGGASVLPSTAPAAANSGEAGGTFVTGGSGGPIQDGNGGKGGGGGGAYVKTFMGGTDSPDGTPGKDGLGANLANAGFNFQDDAFDAAPTGDPSGAGSGGGGGSGFQSGVNPGNSSGGGGGAGGGSILIYAVEDVLVNGSILADGGDGGAVANPLIAGAGGGGGGGSIVIMTVGDIVNDGTISAVAGNGGAAFSSADGGNGYWGRTWVVEKDGYAGGSNIESPETKLNIPGDVRYETGVNYTMESAAIDLGNTRPSFLSAASTLQDQGGSTFIYEYAFGDSVDDPALNSFNLPATYMGTQVGRFAKFRIQLDNLDSQTPARVSLLSLTFDGFEQGQFDFAGACGRVAPIASATIPTLTVSEAVLRIFLYLLPILLLVYLREIYLRRSLSPAKAKFKS